MLTHAALYFPTGCCLYKKRPPNSILFFFLKVFQFTWMHCIIILPTDHGKSASSLVIYLSIFSPHLIVLACISRKKCLTMMADSYSWRSSEGVLCHLSIGYYQPLSEEGGGIGYGRPLRMCSPCLKSHTLYRRNPGHLSTPTCSTPVALITWHRIPSLSVSPSSMRMGVLPGQKWVLWSTAVSLQPSDQPVI